MQNNAYLYTNGTILTMDRNNPEVDAVGVIGDRIVAVGTSDEVRAELPRSHDVFDLKGRTLLPGFNEAHNHMIFFGTALGQIDCGFPTVKSVNDIVESVRERARDTPPGQWILGRGYDDNKLEERRHPNRHDLDQATDQHPVMIVNGSGHLSAVNSRALDAAGVNDSVQDPEGGHFVRDEHGSLTGVLHETAQELIRAVIPPATVEDHVRALEACNDAYIAAGITSSQDAGSSTPDQIRAYQIANERGVLRLRTSLMIRENLLPQIEALGLRQGFGNDRLRIGPIKMFIDGSLIGRTAAVTIPFEEDPSDENYGLTMMSQERLDELVLQSHRLGYQIAIHAIGDRGIDMVLDAYERALTEMPRENHRHRIEHCGICRPDILDRIARLDVIPVSQPIFIDEYGDGFVRHLGLERIQLTYPFRSFVDRGIKLVFSSDCPVSSYHPLKSMQAAVTERTGSGQSYALEEAVTVEEALEMYTVAGAYATFEEETKGKLQQGMLADFVVLDADPRTVDPGELSQIPIRSTIIGGEQVYEN